MCQNDICIFPNNFTLSIHARSPLFSGAQTGLCSSPVHLPSLDFFWAPEFSFLNAALSLSFTLLILDLFYFVLSRCFEFHFYLWKCCSDLSSLMLLEIFLKPGYTTSTAYPYPPVTLPEKEIQLVWHNLLFTDPPWVFLFPLCSQSYWLSIIQLSIFHGVELPLTVLPLSMWIFSYFLKPGTVLFPLVSESHISKLIHTWFFGSTLPGIARSAGNAQGVHGQSCR